METKEKRDYPRRNIRVPILCWNTDEEKRTGRGREIISKNMSADGMTFYSDLIFPIDTTILVDIYLPGRTSPVSCKVKVIRVEALSHSEDYIIGATFTEISLEDKAFVAVTIEKLDLYILLESTIQGGASDLHLTVGRPPMVRKEGRILPMASDVIAEGEVEAMLFPLLTKEQVKLFFDKKEMDFAFSPSIDSRFRVNLHWQKGFVEAALRNIPTKIKTFEELGLPLETMKLFCSEKSGLILITGTTGSGKTTTMSAIVDYINKNYERVVITIEDPVEYTFKSQKSIIKQRELGSDTISYSEALKRVLRQDPDVICIGELLDSECLSAAMRAAETGHLVISTIHAPNTIQAIERVINFFPPEHALTISQQLSSCLLGILFQVLLPSTKGGRIIGTELLINNNAMKNLIRENKYSLMINVLQTGRAQGMYTLKNSLDELLEQGLIDEQTVAEYSKKIQI